MLSPFLNEPWIKKVINSPRTLRFNGRMSVRATFVSWICMSILFCTSPCLFSTKSCEKKIVCLSLMFIIFKLNIESTIFFQLRPVSRKLLLTGTAESLVVCISLLKTKYRQTAPDNTFLILFACYSFSPMSLLSFCLHFLLIAVVKLVEALHYKLGGRGLSPDEVVEFIFSVLYSSSYTMTLRLAQPLTETSIMKCFWGVKPGRSVRLITSPHLWADCLENLGFSTYHNFIGLHGLLQGELYLRFLLLG
jgi:hypothetical protein